MKLAAPPFGRRGLPARRALLYTSRGHFAENDEFEPQSSVDQLEESLRRAGRQVTFYRYPGTGHWFFEPDRPDAYNEAAAKLEPDSSEYF